MRFLLQIVISTLVFLGISDSIYFATQLLGLVSKPRFNEICLL